MENFYDYTIENYTLTDEGIHFIESVVADNIGMDRQEIIDNWR